MPSTSNGTRASAAETVTVSKFRNADPGANGIAPITRSGYACVSVADSTPAAENPNRITGAVASSACPVSTANCVSAANSARPGPLVASGCRSPKLFALHWCAYTVVRCNAYAIARILASSKSSPLSPRSKITSTAICGAVSYGIGVSYVQGPARSSPASGVTVVVIVFTRTPDPQPHIPTNANPASAKPIRRKEQRRIDTKDPLSPHYTQAHATELHIPARPFTLP